MRTMTVVVDQPSFDDGASLVESPEDVLVQAFITVSSVEALDVDALDRVPRADEVELHALLVRPGIERLPGELRDVVHGDDPRQATGGRQLLVGHRGILA